VTIDYNANGQRSHYTASVPGQPTLTETFGYRGNELGQAVVVRGTQVYTDTYIYSPNGTPLELLRQQGTGTSRYWYVLDGRGNVTALTNVSGKIVDFYTYDVWGRPTTTYETVAQPLRYGGYWYDREMGWYWAGVRSYDPTLKRWLQPDPSRIDGARTYAYAADNPIDEVDPSGFAPHQSSGLLGLAVSHFGQIAASFQALQRNIAQAISSLRQSGETLQQIIRNATIIEEVFGLREAEKINADVLHSDVFGVSVGAEAAYGVGAGLADTLLYNTHTDTLNEFSEKSLSVGPQAKLSSPYAGLAHAVPQLVFASSPSFQNGNGAYGGISYVDEASFSLYAGLEVSAFTGGVSDSNASGIVVGLINGAGYGLSVGAALATEQPQSAVLTFAPAPE